MNLNQIIKARLISQAQIHGPIGIFDSGYGGLTIFREIVKQLPQYDYIYLGDNARVPYGIRTYETVYRYTLECVKHLFNMGCRLVILACNTASAKALRTIQQRDLPLLDPYRRVLGVIRPTTEIIGNLSRTGHVGILATTGTVNSQSYVIEINKLFPQVKVFQEACPMWVPLVENNEHESVGADYFIQKHLHQLLAQSSEIDTIALACTHYPLLSKKISAFLPEHIKVLTQGEIVTHSLLKYLEHHPDLEERCSKQGQTAFYTTESTEDFDKKATIFLGHTVNSRHLEL
ncbi:glutamate racemase [Catalinimonas niigatensis]|uniref:glutamate racemase n=1 Tax=Catalinimonas niigatensis TaxID=1397264 RepID=UPI002667106A|nr:glutamate racemase [Catalinimonas niigatensis]WPP49068.1 glutamate racemase [Catalinimonas niigatensis]